MPQSPPQSIGEFITNLPNSVGIPFWFGLLLLALGLFFVYFSSCQFSRNLQAIRRARVELKHLLTTNYVGASNAYEYKIFTVPSSHLKDNEYDLEFNAITLERNTDVFTREKYTERRAGGKEVTRYRNVWKPHESVAIVTPEYISLRFFKLASKHLEVSDIPITTPLKTNNVHLFAFRQVHEDGYIRFVPEERDGDEVDYGDIRLRYSGAVEQTISTIGKIEAGTLIPYEMTHARYLLERGEKSVAELFQKFRHSSIKSVLAFNAIGAILLIFATMLIYGAYLGRPMNGADTIKFLIYAAFLGTTTFLSGFLLTAFRGQAQN